MEAKRRKALRFSALRLLHFLNRLERDIPAGKIVHAILDNYASHKYPKVRAWLGRRRLQRGVFRSLVDLQAAINRCLADHNQSPRPFTWTADPDTITAAANRGFQVLDSIRQGSDLGQTLWKGNRHEQTPGCMLLDISGWLRGRTEPGY